MKHYIVRRCGYSLLSLFLLSLTIFLFVRVTGDPTVLLVEPGASRADIEALRHDLGLDRSLLVQYGTFVKDVVRGDFGRSFYYRTPVLELYLSRLPNSLLLAAAAMAFSLLIGIPSGIIAAVRVNGWWDSGRLDAGLRRHLGARRRASVRLSQRRRRRFSRHDPRRNDLRPPR